MAKRASDKRVFARERVNVDERTQGIRGAARPSDAMGSRQERSTGYQGSGSSAALWGNVSKTLGGLMVGIGNMSQKESREAEKARDREQRLEDQRQTNAGIAAGNHFRNEVMERRLNGELQSFTEIEDFKRMRVEEHGPVVGTVFRNAMEAQVNAAMVDFSKEINASRKAELNNLGRSLSGNTYRSAFGNLELSDDDFMTQLEGGLISAVDMGVAHDVAFKDIFDAGVSAMRTELLKGNSTNATAIKDRLTRVGIANLVPLQGGTSGEEILEEQFFLALRQQKDAELKEQAVERQQTQLRQKDSTVTFMANLGKIQSVEDLKAYQDRVKDRDPDDLVDEYGADALSVQEAIQAQEDWLLYKKRPEGNLEAVIELEKRFVGGDTDLIHGNYLESIWDKLLPDQKARYHLQREQARQNKDPGVESRIMESISHLAKAFSSKRIDANGKPSPVVAAYQNLKLINDSDSDRPVLTNAGKIVEKRMRDKLAEIDPSSPKYKDNPDALLRDQVAVIRSIEDELKTGQADWLMEKVNIDKRPGEAGVVEDPRFLSARDLQDPMNQQALDAFIYQSGSKHQQLLNIGAIQDLKVQQRALTVFQSRVATKMAEDLYSNYFNAAIADSSEYGSTYTSYATDVAKMAYAQDRTSRGLSDDSTLVGIEANIAREQQAIANLKKQQRTNTRGMSNSWNIIFGQKIQEHERTIERLVQQHQEKKGTPK